MPASSRNAILNPPTMVGERPAITRERVEFERNMGSQSYLNEIATIEEAEVYFRRLIQSAAFLSRRYGFTIGDNLAKHWRFGLKSDE